MGNVRKIKVTFVLTTRGNYAKLKNLIFLCSNNKLFKVHIIIGGALLLSKYAKNILKEIKKNINYSDELFFQLDGENNLTMTKSFSVAVNDLANIFSRVKPDFIFVLADRFEALSVSVAASFMNIQLIHLEGGEKSGSIDDKIRDAITTMSDIHFPCTEQSKKNILKFGINKSKVHNVGSTSFDEIIKTNLSDISFYEKLKTKEGVGKKFMIQKKKYLIFIQHPVTTYYSDNYNNINESLYALEKTNLPVIILWPNMDAGSDGISKGLREFKEKNSHKDFHYFKSLKIELFAPLLNNAACIVGNSSSGIRESSFLGVPSVNIGDRQNNRERANNVFDVPYNSNKILEAINFQVKKNRFRPSKLYGDGKASKKIIDIFIKTEIK